MRQSSTPAVLRILSSAGYIYEELLIGTAQICLVTTGSRIFNMTKRTYEVKPLLSTAEAFLTLYSCGVECTETPTDKAPEGITTKHTQRCNHTSHRCDTRRKWILYPLRKTKHCRNERVVTPPGAFGTSLLVSIKRNCTETVV